MYKFTKDCMTGIESIDKEHEQLFKIINEAQALLEEQAVDVKTVKRIMPQSILHTRKHIWSQLMTLNLCDRRRSIQTLLIKLNQWTLII